MEQFFLRHALCVYSRQLTLCIKVVEILGDSEKKISFAFEFNYRSNMMVIFFLI